MVNLIADWGSKFWCWGGLGFEILVLRLIGVRGFGPGMDWGSRFWGFVIRVRGFGAFSGSLGKVKKSENNQVKIPF